MTPTARRGRARRLGLSRHRPGGPARLADRRWRHVRALTTARLGLRTAAVVGVDAEAASARELDLLRDAGVDILLVPLRGPVYHNVETPAGASRPASSPGCRCRPGPAAERGSRRPAGRRPGRRRGPRRLGRRHPARAHVAVAWQGFLRDLGPGERSASGRREGRAILRRADLVGVSRQDVAPGRPLGDLAASAPSGRGSARSRRAARRPADPAGRRRPGDILRYLPPVATRRSIRPGPGTRSSRRSTRPGFGREPVSAWARRRDPRPTGPAVRRRGRIARRRGWGSPASRICRLCSLGSTRDHDRRRGRPGAHRPRMPVRRLWSERPATLTAQGRCRPGGGPLEPRATSRTGSTVPGAVASARLARRRAPRRRRRAARPGAPRPSGPSRRRLGDGRQRRIHVAAMAMSSKPTTLMSPGTVRPAARTARIAPIAMRSL